MTAVEKPPRSNTLTYRVSHPSQYRAAVLESGNHHPHPVGFGGHMDSLPKSATQYLSE